MRARATWAGWRPARADCACLSAGSTGLDHTSNGAALATSWVRSPREAFESIYAGGGATQAEIDTYHLRREPVSQASADGGLPRGLGFPSGPP
jgi:hypothetical protein